MTTRQEIADALAVVPELTPSATPPAQLLFGVAFPVWSATEYETRCITRKTWHVYVVISDATTGDETDELADAIGQALMKIGNVERLEPYGLSQENGGANVPAIRATLID